MLDELGSKLVGSKEERAVSPVIGVILMVAITVILAAVIAAFVLDLGGSVSDEAQAGVSLEVDEEGQNVNAEITSMGNSDYVTLAGDASDADGSPFDNDDLLDVPDDEELGVGDTVTLEYGDDDSGTVTAIAVIEEDGTTTQVSSADFDF